MGLWSRGGFWHINCHWTLHTEPANKAIVKGLKKPYTMFTIKSEELPGSRMYTINQRRGGRIMCVPSWKNSNCSPTIVILGTFWHEENEGPAHNNTHHGGEALCQGPVFSSTGGELEKPFSLTDKVNESHTDASGINRPALLVCVNRQFSKCVSKYMKTEWDKNSFAVYLKTVGWCYIVKSDSQLSFCYSGSYLCVDISGQIHVRMMKKRDATIQSIKR